MYSYNYYLIKTQLQKFESSLNEKAFQLVIRIEIFFFWIFRKILFCIKRNFLLIFLERLQWKRWNYLFFFLFFYKKASQETNKKFSKNIFKEFSFKKIWPENFDWMTIKQNFPLKHKQARNFFVYGPPKNFWKITTINYSKFTRNKIS